MQLRTLHSLKSAASNMMHGREGAFKESLREVKNSLQSMKTMRRQTAPTLYELTEKTGSYLYMAPEMLLGQPYNEKVQTVAA